MEIKTVSREDAQIHLYTRRGDGTGRVAASPERRAARAARKEQFDDYAKIVIDSHPEVTIFRGLDEPHIKFIQAMQRALKRAGLEREQVEFHKVRNVPEVRVWITDPNLTLSPDADASVGDSLEDEEADYQDDELEEVESTQRVGAAV